MTEGLHAALTDICGRLNSLKIRFIPLVHVPSNVQLDLVIGMSGFEHDIVERADPMHLNDLELHVATAEDLILLKLIADRPQDHHDIRGMLDVQGEGLDWYYCHQVASQLQEAVGIDLLEKISSMRNDV